MDVYGQGVIMFKKILGGGCLVGAVALVGNAMVRWIPLVTAWMVETGRAANLARAEAWSAFMTFQANDPALAGLVSLIAGAAFAVVGYLLFRDGTDGPRKPMNIDVSFGRADREARQWEKDQASTT